MSVNAACPRRRIRPDSQKYGLDKPLWEQYVRYMWHAVHLDFGVPFQSPTDSVMGLIKRAPGR